MYAVTAKDLAIRSRARRLYHTLKKDVVDNVLRQWQETGFLFENYDSSTGKGRGTRPFTGWSALVVLLMGDEAAGDDPRLEL